MTSLLSRKPREVTSVTIENGFIKLLHIRGQQVVDYQIAPVTSRFFREGLVSSTERVARVMRSAVEEMGGVIDGVSAAVPGFQANIWLLALPSTRGLDPKVVIPQDASRRMGISPENSFLTWKRLPDRLDQRQWLVLSATRRSIASVADTVQHVGLKLRRLELRPFALARAVNQTDAMIVCTFTEGADVVIVRNSAPVAYTGVFWGAEPVDGTVLVNRLSEVAERTLATYDQNTLDGPLSDEVPVYVCGSPISLEPSIASQLAVMLQRPAGKLSPPLDHPDDFPIHDLIVNIGLTLAEV